MGYNIWQIWSTSRYILGKDLENNYCRFLLRIYYSCSTILQEYPDLQFQQDNAKGHSASFTKSVFEALGIKPIFWPANSPDLNPIETIWDLLKNYIERNYPKVHISYDELRRLVQEAWESITHETIRALIQEMGDRCIEVILADGGHTKY